MPKQTKIDGREQFLRCSAVVTGFGRLDLVGTGMLDAYYQTLTGIVAAPICTELWAAFDALERQCGGDLERLEEAVTKQLVAADHKLGPVLKAIVQLWYLGQWIQLPSAWRAKHGASPKDVTHIVSPEAYTQGLAWQAAGTHPQGAKQPGYGSWSLPPIRIAGTKAPKADAAAGSK
jgi:hypothetical protein